MENIEGTCEEITSANFQLQEIDVGEIVYDTEQEQIEQIEAQDDGIVWIPITDECVGQENRIVGLPLQAVAHDEPSGEVESEEKPPIVDVFQNEEYVDAVDFLNSEVKILLGESESGKKIYGKLVNVRSSTENDCAEYIQIDATAYEVHESAHFADDHSQLSEDQKPHENISKIPANTTNDVADISALQRVNEKMIKKEEKKIYIGKSAKGKQIYGRIIGVKSANGSKVTDKKTMSALHEKIKGGLGQIILSAATSLMPNDKQYNTECSQSNAELETITYANCEETQYLQDVNKSDVAENSTEKEKELSEVKDILKSLTCLVDTSNPERQANQILNKLLKVNKMVHRENDGDEFGPKEYTFTGKMQGSIEAGWEFVETSDVECMSLDLFHIDIRVDKNSKKSGINFIVEFNQTPLRPTKLKRKESVSEDESFMISAAKKVNGKKYYDCRVCKSRIYGSLHYKQHMKVHCPKSNDPNALVKCPFCDCVFFHGSTRTRHIVKMHRNEGTVYAS